MPLSSRNREASAKRRLRLSSPDRKDGADGLSEICDRISPFRRIFRAFIDLLNSATAAESASDCFFLSVTFSAEATDLSNDSETERISLASALLEASSKTLDATRVSKLAAFPLTAQRTYEKNQGALRS